MRSKHGADSCGRDLDRRTDRFYDEQVLQENENKQNQKN